MKSAYENKRSWGMIPVEKWNRQGRAGMALVTVMVVLMMIMALLLVGVATGTTSNPKDSGGLASTSTNVMFLAKARMRSTAAYNAAESGIQLAMQWLRGQASPPANNTAFAPDMSGWGSTTSNTYTVFSNFNNSGADIKIRMYPYTSNSSAGLKSYVVETIGTASGVNQVVRAVVIQNTFAKYAFFTDNASDNWWVGGITKFNGPVQINDSNAKSINILWKSGGNTNNQIFTYSGTDAFSTSATTINWNKNTVTPPTSQTGPSTTSDWKGVAAGGATSIHTGVAQVTLPAASTVQAVAALGPTTAVPTSSTPIGVQVPNAGSAANGGIYIHGDVDSMVLGAIPGANPNGQWTAQTIAVTQTDSANNRQILTTVTIDPVANTTKTVTQTRAIGATTWPTGTTQTYTGTTNGVVYTDGNIGNQGDSRTAKSGGLSGVIADSLVNPPGGSVINPSTPTSDTVTYQNKLNIVTDASKNLNINGSVTYAAGYNRTNSPILGIVSKTIEIVDNNSSGTALTNVTVHGTVLAYDTFDVTDPTTRPSGTFTMVGGYIASNAGQFGTFDSYSGKIVNGFAKTLNYDSRMADTPPPFFPSTANQYLLQSEQRVQTTLQ